MEIIHRMKNPFEMFYVFEIAKKYPLNIETEKEQILILKKILKHVFCEKTEINEDVIETEQIRNYINKKNIYDINWLENLKTISKKASEFLIFEINEELQNLLNYYYSLYKNDIEKQNEEFLQSAEYTWGFIKEKINEIEIIEKSQFDKYFEIREKKLIEKESLQKTEKRKEEIEEDIRKKSKELDEINSLQNQIFENERLINQLKEEYEAKYEKIKKIEEETDERAEERNKIEEILHSYKLKLQKDENEVSYIQIELLEEESRIQELKNGISEKIRSNKEQLEKINSSILKKEEEKTSQLLKLEQLEINDKKLGLSILERELQIKKTKEELNQIREQVEMTEPQKRELERKIEDLELELKKTDVEINKRRTKDMEQIQKNKSELEIIRKAMQEKENELNNLNIQIHQISDLKIKMNNNKYAIEVREEENRNKNEVLDQKIGEFRKKCLISEIYIEEIKNKNNQKKIKSIFNETLHCLNSNTEIKDISERNQILFEIKLNIDKIIYQYRKIKEHNDTITKIKGVLDKGECFRRDMFRYLGQQFESEFIKEDGDFFIYDYKEIDKHYLINLLITLLKNNKLYENELIEYDMNNIENVLRKKDEELKNKYSLIKISENTSRALSYIKTKNTKYKYYDIVSGNTMWVEDFVDLKKHIKNDLRQEKGRIPTRYIDILEDILWDIDDYKIENPKISEILQYRAYCLLYAIIKKETRKKSDYKNAENFYEELSKILDENDIKLREGMLKLDI